MKSEINDFNNTDVKIFVGLDVHLKNWKATIMVEDEPFKTLSMNPYAETLKAYLDKNFPGCEYYSAYEAGFCGFSVHRSLSEHGVNNIIVNPADIPTTNKERNQKEDKRDSRKIAKSLRAGLLLPIYIPSKAMEELRSLVRYRKTLVKEVNRNKTRIKSYLYCHGIEIPKELSVASKYWSSNFSKWLETIRLDTEYGHIVILKTLEIVKHLRETLLSVTKEIKKIIKGNALYDRTISNLRSIPGIGFIVAITILSEIENIHRFKTLDQFCSFIGLVPSTNSSGEKDRTGNITKRSSKPLREVIIESAWVSIRNDASMALAYRSLCKRMTPNKAIVRIAKKLLNRIRYVLINETKYEIISN